MKTKITTSLITGVLLFSGCAKQFNSNFKKNIKYDIDTSSKNIDMSKYIKQKSNNHFFIDFSINKDLISALNQLNQIDKNNVYVLKNKQDDIIFPTLTTNDSKKLDINSFYKLQQFIKNTTNYILTTKENPFNKGFKQVIVIDKSKLKNNIFNYPFNIHGAIPLQKILNEISKITHFSVIIQNGTQSQTQQSSNPIQSTSQVTQTQSVSTQLPTQQGEQPPATSSNSSQPMQPQSQPIQSPTQLLSPKINNNNIIINFNGKTIGDFLNYISNQFNYFVDINYKNKLIILKKYKTFTFNILLPDVKINNLSSASASSSSSTTSNTATGNANFTAPLNEYAEGLINTVSSFITNGTFKYKNGIIFAKITKNEYLTISKFIKQINQNFMKQATLSIDIYVFAVSQNFNFGTDLSFIKNNINAITKYNSNPFMTLTKNSNSGTIKRKLTVNSDNSNLYFLTKYSTLDRIINKIPITINLTKNQSYLKSIQTTTTTSTATTSTTTAQIGQIVEGEQMTIIPNIYSDKIFLDALFTNTNNEEMEEKQVGQQTIMLPTNVKKVIPITTVLKYGDKKIVGVYQSYVKYDNVKSLLPTNIPIISRVVGNNQIKYVRELIAVVVGVKK